MEGFQSDQILQHVSLQEGDEAEGGEALEVGIGAADVSEGTDAFLVPSVVILSGAKNDNAS